MEKARSFFWKSSWSLYWKPSRIFFSLTFWSSLGVHHGKLPGTFFLRILQKFLLKILQKFSGVLFSKPPGLTCLVPPVSCESLPEVFPGYLQFMFGIVQDSWVDSRKEFRGKSQSKLLWESIKKLVEVFTENLLKEFIKDCGGTYRRHS